jgi:hypothetical protein
MHIHASANNYNITTLPGKMTEVLLSACVSEFFRDSGKYLRLEIVRHHLELKVWRTSIRGPKQKKVGGVSAESTDTLSNQRWRVSASARPRAYLRIWNKSHRRRVLQLLKHSGQLMAVIYVPVIFPPSSKINISSGASQSEFLRIR